MLVWISCPALSQDTLNSIPVIEHNGQQGLFLDSTNAVLIAHKLEDGESTKRELSYCDSSLQIADSTNKVLTILNEGLERDVDLSESQTKAALDKSLLHEEKYILCDDQRRKARRQRWLWGTVGSIGGVAVGTFIGILLK